MKNKIGVYHSYVDRPICGFRKILEITVSANFQSVKISISVNPSQQKCLLYKFQLAKSSSLQILVGKDIRLYKFQSAKSSVSVNSTRQKQPSLQITVGKFPSLQISVSKILVAANYSWQKFPSLQILLGKNFRLCNIQLEKIPISANSTEQKCPSLQISLGKNVRLYNIQWAKRFFSVHINNSSGDLAENK